MRRLSSAGRNPRGYPAGFERKKRFKERLVGMMKSKKKSKMILVSVLVLALSGCVAALWIANRSSGLSKLNGTAYSRRMDGSIFNWHDNGCAYSLSEDGTVTVSYKNGKKLERVPMKLYTASGDGIPKEENAGVFLSPERSAIAYIDKPGDRFIAVQTSGDSGRTWDMACITYDKPVTWIKLGFTTKKKGWLIVCTFVAMGQEEHDLFKTADGGRTWTPITGNLDEMHGRVLTGAGFVNENIGFACFRYETDFQPAVCETRDGGQTWEKVPVPLSKAYDGYSKTALSPACDGKDIVLPVLLSNASGEEKMIYLKSSDLGATWREENAD